MRPILCIRPEPGLSHTLAKAKQMGLEITGISLFQVESIGWELPDLKGFDGLLIGSANAVRHGGDQLQKLLHLPVHAVGQTTADAARDAGFRLAPVGQGGLQGLLDNLPVSPIRLLRLAGAERVPLSPASWQKIEEVVVYRSSPVIAPMAILDLLQQNPIVALHSANAAQHFSNECNRLGVSREVISIAVLGPRIADAAGKGWREVAISPKPDDASLLAIIENMCK